MIKHSLPDGRSEPPCRPPGGGTLEDKLRQWRREIARDENVPAYRVLTDETLMLVARSRPSTLEDLPAIRGMGARKIARYGPTLVQLVEGDEGLPLPPPPNPEWLADLAGRFGLGKEVFAGLNLAERTQAVLARRLGAHDGRRWSVAEVADYLGIAPPKAAQLEVQGLARIVSFLLAADLGRLVPSVLVEAS